MTTRPPVGCSVPNMVQRYLGTEYDTVKLIADNLEALLKLAVYVEAGAYFQLPVGTTAQRPTNPANGMIRFNSDIPGYEGYNTNGWAGLGGGSLSFQLASRITANGSDYVFDIGGVDYFDEKTLFVFTDTGWQRPITDFTIGAAGTANQGKLVMKEVPPAGTIIDVIRLVSSAAITGAGEITFATVVPNPETTLTPWFVNLKTSKTYMRVVGGNATYWVEQNSHGQL